MIRLEDSKYNLDLPEGKFLFPLGPRPFEIDEECDECHSNRFRVAVFYRTRKRRGERPFFGGLIFLTCEACKTVYVTRLPKDSDRKRGRR